MKTTPAFLVLFCLCGCLASTGQRLTVDPRDPSWEELAAFLGVKKDDPGFQAFAQKYKLDEATKGPSGMFSTHGYSATLLYRRNIFSRVIVSPRHAPGFRPYSGKLPFGLKRSDTMDSVIRKFGKPSYTQGTSVLHFVNRKLGFAFMKGTVSQITLDYD